MNKRTFAIVIAILTFIVGVAIAKLSLPFTRQTPVSRRPQVIQLSNYRLSGPFKHENLTIYLIHGSDQPNTNTRFTPLKDAMERKLAFVYETSDVNELWIENQSNSEELFVQAGDIVKGGQQDRVLAIDLILPAHSGRIPIAAFCVEPGRWRQRGFEQADQFSMSDQMVATRALKLATKSDASQGRVWDEVSAERQRLSAGVAANVSSEVSESSLQLAQEHEEVQKAAEVYVKNLSSIVDDSADAIGFAFVINNELNSAEIYASNAMFRRFWPKLLKTTAIEAVAERSSFQKSESVLVNVTAEFFADGERGVESFRHVSQRTHMMKREGEKTLFFETRDMAQRGAWIHRSYLMK
jgi:hypothetical protein